MPSKAVELTVEIVIDSVTCPGVWLCAEGDVSLSVFALGSSHHTARLPPLFPLQYKDTFFFRKRFKNVCSVSNLNYSLKGETIYCELIQWKRSCEPCVLAQYLGSISDVLFPPDTCTSDGVDLLMRRTADFPGILSPKIELSTKVRVDEVYDDASQQSNARSLSPIEVAVGPQSDTMRQKRVCHSKNYHRNRCISCGQSPKRRCKAVQTALQNEHTVPCIGLDDSISQCIDGTNNSAELRHRVAHVIESGITARSSNRTRGRSPSSAKKELLKCAYPCMCEICQQYHRTFHVK